MGYFVKNRSVGRTPEGMVIPDGTTLNRPTDAVDGSIRYNTTTSTMEYFNGTEFVEIAKTGEVNIVVDTFTGDNVQVTFTTTVTMSNTSQVIIFVGGVYQQPSTYSVVGTTLTFSEAPPLNSTISIIHNIGLVT